MSEQEKVKSLIEGFVKLEEKEKSIIVELVERLTEKTSAKTVQDKSILEHANQVLNRGINFWEKTAP